MAEKDQFTLGLVLETYAYLALVSNVIPYGLLKERVIELDDFVTRLAHLKQYPTFGTFFSCGYDVFECIAPVALVARRCIDDISAFECVSDETWSLYAGIKSRVEGLDIETVTNKPLPQGAEQVYELYRLAILIFLETAHYGSGTDDDEVMEAVQKHVDKFMELSHNSTKTKYRTISVWPLLIAGSCCIKEVHRDRFRARVRTPTGRWRVNQTITAVHVLELLWSSDDKLAFGPYGLYLMMRKHGISISMA